MRIVCLPVLSLFFSLSAAAASFSVDSTNDAPDARPGDGVCASAAGECTLRAAVMEANALGGPHTVSVPPGLYRLTRAGAGEDASATGDLDLLTALAIEGAGAAETIVDGALLD